MPEHIVEQGECLASIARRHGFADWRTIYNDQKNNQFRLKRKNPNVLFPGDRIFIPDKEGKFEEGCTEQRHRFRLIGNRVELRIIVEDAERRPYENKKYKLTVENKTYEGRTDSKGLIKQRVPATAQEGELCFWFSDEPGYDPMIWFVRIGHLDPHDCPSGVKGRLGNLSLPCDEPDNKLRESTKEGLLAFQAHNGLPITGEMDEVTRKKLVEVHKGDES